MTSKSDSKNKIINGTANKVDISPKDSKDGTATAKVTASLFDPRVLILGAGGIKGFFELGALYYLEKIGHLKHVETFIGISIGAIIGLLMVCGCDIQEIITHAVDTEIFQDFKNIDLTTILGNTGIISNEKIKDKMSDIVRAKFGFVPTLAALYEMTGKTLITVTNNLTLRRAEYLSYKTASDMSCVDAAMYSINIPGVFHKLCYRDNVYVDGALIDPYPLALVDDGKTDILGIYIDEAEGVTLKTSSIGYLSQALLSPIRELREKSIAAASKRCKHIRLRTNIIDTTGFLVSQREKGRMLAEGHAEAIEYIELLKRDERSDDDKNPEVVSSAPTATSMKTGEASNDETHKNKDSISEK